MNSKDNYLINTITETLRGTIYSDIDPERIIEDLPKEAMTAAQLNSAILISAARLKQ